MSEPKAELDSDRESGTKSSKHQSPIMEAVLGYPRIAEWMSRKPECAVFRIFSALNTRNLLYMQAELCRLEIELIKQEKEDNQSSVGNKNQYAVNWGWLRLAPLDENPPKQLNLVKEIRGKLREYHETLLQQARLHKLKEPDTFDLSALQHFFGSPETMNEWCMTGDDSNVWGSVIDPKETSPDLVAVLNRYKEDKFSTWVAENAVHLFKLGWGKFKKRSKRTGEVGYHESSVLRVTFFLTSMIASLIPIASIIVLVRLSERPLDKVLRAQIGTIAGFNVLISFCLTIFTDAKRTDVFAVTAAFTAVQAVFLGMDSDWKSQ